MAATRKLQVLIAGDAKGVQKAFRDVQSAASGAVSNLRSRFDSLGTAVKVGTLAAAGGLAVLGKGAIDEAQQMQAAMGQVQAVLQSTGGVANVSAGHVQEMASKLQALTAVDDDVIAHGQGVLLTFTNVRNAVGAGNDIFDQATKIALDMSKALGQDMQQSVIQVGKALQDPIRGVTALRRVGVQLSAQQEEQVKTFVKSGNVMAAQKVILGELQREFGGAAAAMATPTEKLHAALKSTEGDIGAALLPVLNALLPAFQELLGPVGALAQALLLPGAKFLVDFVKAITPALKVLTPILGSVATLLGKALADALRQLAPYLPQLAKMFGQLLLAGLKGIIPLLPPLIDGFIVLLKVVTPLINFLAAHPAVLVAVAAAMGLLLGAINPVTLAIGGLILVIGLVKQHWTGLVNFFRQWWPLLLSIFTGGLGFIILAFVRWHDQIFGFFSGAISWLLNAGRSIITGLWNGAVGVWNAVWGWLSSLPGRIISIFAAAGSWLLDRGRAILGGLWQGAVGIWGVVWGWFAGLPGKFKAAFANAGSWLVSAGRAIIQGLIDGIRAAGGGIARAIHGIMRSIPGASLLAKIPGIGGLFRAAGGPVSAGMPYIVGERGPELFVPRSSGVILPNGSGLSLGAAHTPAAPTFVSVNVTVNGSVQAENDLAETIRNALLRKQRQSPVPILPGVA